MAKKSLPRLTAGSPVILSFAFIYALVFALEEALNMPVSARFLDCPPASLFNFTAVLDYVKVLVHVFSRGAAGEFFPCLVCIIVLGCETEERYGSAMTCLMMLIASLVEGVLCVLLAPKALGGGFAIAFMLIILWGMSFFSKKQIPLLWIFLAVAFVVLEATLLRPVVAGESFADSAICVLIKLIAAVTGSFSGLFTAPRISRRTKAAPQHPGQRSSGTDLPPAE